MSLNKKAVKQLLKIQEEACYWHLSTSELPLKKKEVAKRDRSYKYWSDLPKGTAKFYPEHGGTEVLNIDMAKLPKGVKTITVAKSKPMDIFIFSEKEEIEKEIFKRAKIDVPEDRLTKDLVLLALDNYGWDIATRLKKWHKKVDKTTTKRKDK